MRQSRFTSFLILAAWCAGLGAPQPLAAQVAGQPVSGVVVDGSGGAIRGAAITLSLRGGEPRQTTTDAAGRFVFDRVPGGQARLTATFQGFAAVTIDLDGPRENLRVVMQPIPVSEALTVRAPLPPVSRRLSSKRPRVRRE